MKSKILGLSMVVLLFWGCQQPSKVAIATTGPEIESQKKSLEAYVNGDWATYRADYADTAKIFFNNQQFDPDSLVRWQQARRATYDKVAASTDGLEFVTYENGEGWIHWWGKLSLTVKGTGRVVEVPLHLAGKVVGGKTVEQYGYFNTQEMFVALQEAAAPPSPPVK